MKKTGKKKFIYLALAGLLVLIVILVLANRKAEQGEGGEASHKLAKQYSDSVCQVKFQYPESWTKSGLILPLSQKPLSEATFDEPGKKSIFSYICYDATKYSFDQFIKESSFAGQIESINVGEVRWQRVGNFLYTVQNNKLIIFEMFFTKYDLKPEPGYEETFLNIIQSVQF